MTRRHLLAFCTVLLLATPLLAQSKPKPASDPISGTWTGELVLAGRNATPITLELKLDSKNAITGTMTGLPNPGDVKAGSYDPKKGALKLQIGKAGEQATLLTLEGSVAKGVAAGKFTGEESGEFKFTKKS